MELDSFCLKLWHHECALAHSTGNFVHCHEMAVNYMHAHTFGGFKIFVHPWMTSLFCDKPEISYTNPLLTLKVAWPKPELKVVWEEVVKEKNMSHWSGDNWS